MSAERNTECCALPTGKGASCRVEAIISVDERGQMVLPKETRERADIRAGDKLALIAFEKEGKACCLALIKVQELAEMVKDMLGPVMKEITGERSTNERV